jgi:hypothetical protein
LHSGERKKTAVQWLQTAGVDKISNRLHGQVQSRPDKERPYPATETIERLGNSIVMALSGDSHLIALLEGLASNGVKGLENCGLLLNRLKLLARCGRLDQAETHPDRGADRKVG